MASCSAQQGVSDDLPLLVNFCSHKCSSLWVRFLAVFFVLYSYEIKKNNARNPVVKALTIRRTEED